VAKALGIDYGTKRTGISITDNLKIIASGLTTVSTHLLDEFISDLLKKENIDCFVIGDPKNLDGTKTKTSQHIDVFIRRLEVNHPEINIEKVDERFTSKIAKRSILISGVNRKRRQDKRLVDKLSATLILQSYLDAR
tara:strand:- start:594 stop:1004 length:411 start_codon:yes stop_codon:yes gene_type:complete